MSSNFDTKAQPFKAWLRNRLKQGKRDAVDALAKKLLADTRIPTRGSKALYLAQLRAKGYTAEDITAFNQAWLESEPKPMINQNSNEAMSALYGPAAQHSEYSRFTRVKYREGGTVKQGMIIWITEATKDNPMLYIIEQEGFPDFVPGGDITGTVEE